MNNKKQKTFSTIILSLLILIVSQLIAQLLASGLVLIKIPEYICNVVAGILYIMISYHFLKLLCHKYLKSKTEKYYISKFKINIKWLIIGLILPLLVIGIYLLLPGNFEIVTMKMTKKLTLIAAGVFFSGIGVGVVEEMVFRGIIMNCLKERYNKKIAIIVPSILFGLVHILGMNFNIISCLLVVLSGTMVGIMFSLIAEESKSIWSSAIVHILWNIIIIGGILHIGNSIDEYSIYNYVLNTKSFLITGGEFGIESSIIALIGYNLVSLVGYCFLKNTKKIK